MIYLEDIETKNASIMIIECDCGYHMGIDNTFLEQVSDLKINCPSCQTVVDTKLFKILGELK